MAMNQRHFIVAGLKLIGLFLLVTSLPGLLLNITSMFFDPPGFVGTRSTGGQETDMYRSYCKLAFQHQCINAFWNMTKALVGLYFCRGGKMVVAFLRPDNDKDG